MTAASIAGRDHPDGERLRSVAADLLEERLSIIPDFPIPGTRYLDFYRTYESWPDTRAAVIECLVRRYDTPHVEAVAAVGNGGFGIGSCVALGLGIPFHPIRKAGDTVYGADEETIGMVYAQRSLTLARDIVPSGQRIVLIDDSVATGGTLSGAVALLRRAGATVVEIATLFETTSKGGRAHLAPIELFSILSKVDF